jgi:membrane protein required for colicin V production
LGRGLIIVVVAFLFFDWLVPAKSQPTWVQSAKSKVVLQSTGDWLKAMLPDDPESTILKRLKRPKGDETDTPDGQPADTRSDLGNITGSVTPAGERSGYGRNDRDGMRQLIENKAATAR